MRSPARSLAAARLAASSLAAPPFRALSTAAGVAVAERPETVVETASVGLAPVKTEEQVALEAADVHKLELARKELDAKLQSESSTQINDPQVRLSD